MHNLSTDNIPQLPESFTMPLVFRSSFFGFVNKEETLFLLMEMESLIDRVFEKKTELMEDGNTIREYWELIIVIDVEKIYNPKNYSDEELSQILEMYKDAKVMLNSKPDVIDNEFKICEKISPEGKALWIVLEREGLMVVEKGIQRLYQKLPSGILQEISLTAPKPENKVILTGTND